MSHVKIGCGFFMLVCLSLASFASAGAQNKGEQGCPKTALELAQNRCVFIETKGISEGKGLMGALASSTQRHGTGVVIQDNLVLTNCHLLGEANARVLVDGKEAKLVRLSKAYDLALLSVPTRELPRLQIEQQLDHDQPLVLVGDPGDEKNIVMTGKVLGADDTFIYADMFADVKSAMGASGSGLYSLSGDLIGIQKGMIPEKDGRPPLTVAIPAATIRKFLQDE
jgi:S1-C subfamily serine protease